MVTSPLRTRRRSRTNKMRSPSLEWLQDAQLALAWGIILIIVGLAAGVYLVQVSRTAIIGRNTELLEFEVRDLRYENALLRQEIAAAQSLDRLQGRSNTVGMDYVSADPALTEYLNVVVPLPPPTPEPVTLPLETPHGTIQDALSQVVVNNVQAFARGVSGGE